MRLLILTSFIYCYSLFAIGQSSVTPMQKELRHSEGVWFGIYTKYDFNEKWAYYGEYHARLREGMGEMGQIYLRLGATYKVSDFFELTAGIVNPYYWAPNPEESNINKVVPQYRLWQQAVLATPFDHIKVLHQLRTEQRWRRDYVEGSPFELTYRFRYKLTVYIPLNHADFTDNTLFLALYDELFIQAGKSVIYNTFEDNRAFVGLGYNINHDFQIQMGYMNSFRHDGAPNKYEVRHLLRLNFYHHMNFNKEKRIPDVMIH